MSNCLILLLVCTVSASVNAQKITQLYEGPPLSREKVARITSSRNVSLMGFDDKWFCVTQGYVNQGELLPGTYRLRLLNWTFVNHKHITSMAVVPVELKAGGNYIITSPKEINFYDHMTPAQLIANPEGRNKEKFTYKDDVTPAQLMASPGEVTYNNHMTPEQQEKIMAEKDVWNKIDLLDEFFFENKVLMTFKIGEMEQSIEAKKRVQGCYCEHVPAVIEAAAGKNLTIRVGDGELRKVKGRYMLGKGSIRSLKPGTEVMVEYLWCKPKKAHKVDVWFPGRYQHWAAGKGFIKDLE